jgi:hypothetical protein
MASRNDDLIPKSPDQSGFLSISDIFDELWELLELFLIDYWIFIDFKQFYRK